MVDTFNVAGFELDRDSFLLGLDVYQKFKDSDTYEEEYKWKIMDELNKWHASHTLSAENVGEYIGLMRELNPQKGALANWRKMDDLEEFAEESPRQAAESLRNLLHGDDPLENRIQTFREKVNVGTATIAYLFASRDKTSHAPFKQDVIVTFLSYLSDQEEFSLPGRVPEKYVLYRDILNDLAKFMQKEDDQPKTALDAQDFMYVITQYNQPRCNFILRFLFRFSELLASLEENSETILNQLLSLPNTFLEEQRDGYRDQEKVRTIRFRVLDELLQGEDPNFGQIKQEVEARYEKNILHSWTDFTILTQIFLNYFNDRINRYLDDLSTYLKDQMEKKEELQIHTVDFTGEQNFPIPRCWIAIYPASKGNHKRAYQFHLTIDSGTARFGICEGSETVDDFDRNMLEVDSESNLDIQSVLKRFREVEDEFYRLNNQSEKAPESVVLGSPFDRIFRNRDEAEQAFHVLEDIYQRLALDQTGDPRVTLSFRYDRQAIHFTFGNWYLIGFYAPDLKQNRVCVSLQEDRVAEHRSSLDLSRSETDGFTFDTDADEPSVGMYDLSFDELHDETVQEILHQTLQQVNDRFESWDGTPYRASHVPDLDQMVLDRDQREKYLSEGITVESEPPSDPEGTSYYWVTANPDRWSVDEIMDGGEIYYTATSSSGNFRRIKSAFQNASEGDRVIFYESTPVKEIRGIGTVTKGLHAVEMDEDEHPIKGVSFRFDEKISGISWDQLTNTEELQSATPITNQAQGSLFPLEQEEYETILSLEPAEPIKRSETKDWAERINVDGLSNRSFQVDPNGELHFPDELESTLEDQISNAIQAGKHIILVGPPGTGKSKLAQAICEFYLNGHEAGYEMSTATSDWTTFDTIGGLMPEQHGAGRELSFEPGLFLKCFRDEDNKPRNNWLIIDEINRADIDKAFGALFSVLAGDEITLSFDHENGRPVQMDSQDGAETQSTYETLPEQKYLVPDDWRLIATMNTFDKTSLYEMSYAFMRRFAFIPVGVPEDIDAKLIENYLEVWGMNEDEVSAGVVAELWETINETRKIGPALVEDLLNHRTRNGSWSSGVMMYVLPQFEGLPLDDQQQFFNRIGETDAFSDEDRRQLLTYASDFFDLSENELS